MNAILVQFVGYWHLGNLRNNEYGESWRGFADMLLVPLFAYLCAALLFPTSDEDGPVDLKDFYYGNRVWIFGAFAGVALLNAGFLGYIVTQPFALETLRYILFAFTMVALAVTRNEWFHMAVPIVVFLGLLSSIPN